MTVCHSDVTLGHSLSMLSDMSLHFLTDYTQFNTVLPVTVVGHLYTVVFVVAPGFAAASLPAVIYLPSALEK